MWWALDQMGPALGLWWKWMWRLHCTCMQIDAFSRVCQFRKGRTPLSGALYTNAHSQTEEGPCPRTGIGNTRAGLHPVQERLARAHGSQCGFCTPGFVMSMYTLLRSRVEPPSEQDIEENLAGNLWCGPGRLLGPLLSFQIQDWRMMWRQLHAGKMEVLACQAGVSTPNRAVVRAQQDLLAIVFGCCKRSHEVVLKV